MFRLATVSRVSLTSTHASGTALEANTPLTFGLDTDSRLGMLRDVIRGMGPSRTLTLRNSLHLTSLITAYETVGVEG
jgi:hypothetical protein